MKSRDYRLLVKLCLAQFLAMMIWYNYSAVLPLLRKEWALNEAKLGYILAAFQGGYVISVLIAGWASDRWGAKVVFAVSAIETGIFGCLFALKADGFVSALVLRCLAGIGQGGLYVPGIRILCNKYSDKQRNTAIAIYTASLVGANAAAYFLAAPLAAAYGWRLSVLLTSVWAFLGAFIVWRYVSDSPSEQSVAAPLETRNEAALSPAQVRRYRWIVALLILAYSGHMWELYAFWGWIGPFFSAHFQLIGGFGFNESLQLSGLISGIVIMVGGLAPVIGSSLMNKKSFSFSTIIFCSLGMACALLFGRLIGLPTVILVPIAILYGIIATADSSLYKMELSRFISAEQMGTFLGIQSFVGYATTIVSTALFGYIVEHFGWQNAFSLLALGSVAAIIGIIIVTRIDKLSVISKEVR